MTQLSNAGEPRPPTSNVATADIEQLFGEARATALGLAAELQEKDLQIEQLEHDIVVYSDREAEVRQERDRERTEHQLQKRKENLELIALRNVVSYLRERLSQLQGIRTLTHRSTFLSEEASKLREISSERKRIIDELQVQLANLTSAQELYPPSQAGHTSVESPMASMNPAAVDLKKTGVCVEASREGENPPTPEEAHGGDSGEKQNLSISTKGLTDGGDHAGTEFATATVPSSEGDLERLESERFAGVVNQQEQRLEVAPDSQGTKLREAVASILRFNVDFYPNGQVLVTSAYDKGASFVFQPMSKPSTMMEEGTSMQLIAHGEGGPQDLPKLMDCWIEKENGVPCLLASVTLECYGTAKQKGVEGI